MVGAARGSAAAPVASTAPELRLPRPGASTVPEARLLPRWPPPRPRLGCRAPPVPLPLRWCIPQARGARLLPRWPSPRPGTSTAPLMRSTGPRLGCRAPVPPPRPGASTAPRCLHRARASAAVALAPSTVPEDRSAPCQRCRALAPFTAPEVRLPCPGAATALLISTAPEVRLLPLRWRLHRARCLRRVCRRAAGVLHRARGSRRALVLWWHPFSVPKVRAAPLMPRPSVLHRARASAAALAGGCPSPELRLPPW
jgi:hypothetical protein